MQSNIINRENVKIHQYQYMRYGETHIHQIMYFTGSNSNNHYLSVIQTEPEAYSETREYPTKQEAMERFSEFVNWLEA